MTQETTTEEQKDVTTTDTPQDDVITPVITPEPEAESTAQIAQLEKQDVANDWTPEPEAEVNGVDPEKEGTQADPPEPDSFPREYVEKLRDENAKYRRRAQETDQLAQRLHTALVSATGRLQDPTDLPYDAAHLDDSDALEQAIDDLLKAKPHLGSRRPTGSIGQGQTSTNNTVDLAGILRANA